MTYVTHDIQNVRSLWRFERDFIRAKQAANNSKTTHLFHGDALKKVFIKKGVAIKK
jgi:hypothetical protein